MSKALVLAFEIALIALLAFQAARLVWIAVTPAPFFGETPPVSLYSESKLAALTTFNPFLPRGGADAVSVNDRVLQLFGVRITGDATGTAIIGGENGRQYVYAVGDEIAPGVTLRSVAPDHVVLSRGGGAVRLALESYSAPQGATPRAVPNYLSTPSSSSGAPASVVIDDITPQQFLSEAALTPRVTGGNVTGYTLLPRGGGEALARTGLAAGDVLVAVNGNRITPEIYSQLETQFSGGGDIQLTVERGSTTRTITLKPGG